MNALTVIRQPARAEPRPGGQIKRRKSAEAELAEEFDRAVAEKWARKVGNAPLIKWARAAEANAARVYSLADADEFRIVRGLAAAGFATLHWRRNADGQPEPVIVRNRRPWCGKRASAGIAEHCHDRRASGRWG